MGEHHDHDDHHHHEPDYWKHNGVRVIKGDQLDDNTPQTPGMYRQAAINHARVGAQKIWAGTVAIEANARTGVHHHGALESVIFVLRGKARQRLRLPCFVIDEQVSLLPAFGEFTGGWEITPASASRLYLAGAERVWPL